MPETAASQPLLKPFGVIAVGLNAVYCMVVVAGIFLASSGAPSYWQGSVLVTISLLGVLALLRPTQQALWWFALLVNAAFSVLGVGAMVFLLAVETPPLLSSNGLFIPAVAAMLVVPVITTVALVLSKTHVGHGHRSRA